MVNEDIITASKHDLRDLESKRADKISRIRGKRKGTYEVDRQVKTPRIVF